MKKKGLLFLSALLCITAFAFSACGDDDPIEVDKDTLSVTPPSWNFTADEKDAKEFTVTTSATAYAAKPNETWIHVNEGDGKFTVTVDEYTEAQAEANDGKSRKGTVTVSAGNADDFTVNITQAAPGQPAVNIVLSPEALTFEAYGELTKTVEVSGGATGIRANVPAAHRSWLSAEVDGNNIIVTAKLNIAENNEERSADIEVTADGDQIATLPVTQKKSDKDFTIKPSTTRLEFPGSGTIQERTRTMTVTSAAEDLMVIVPEYEGFTPWFTAELVNGTITVIAEENNEGDVRDATFFIRSDKYDLDVTIGVYQEMGEVEVDIEGVYTVTGMKFKTVGWSQVHEEFEEQWTVSWDETSQSYHITGMDITDRAYFDEIYMKIRVEDGRYIFRHGDYLGMEGSYGGQFECVAINYINYIEESIYGVIQPIFYEEEDWPSVCEFELEVAPGVIAFPETVLYGGSRYDIAYAPGMELLDEEVRDEIPYAPVDGSSYYRFIFMEKQ